MTRKLRPPSVDAHQMASVSQPTSQVAAALQERLYRVARQLNPGPGISYQQVTDLRNEIRAVARGYEDAFQGVQAERLQVDSEKLRFQGAAEAAQLRLEGLRREHSLVVAERDALSRQLEDVRVKLESLTERLNRADRRAAELEASYQSAMADLRARVQRQEDKLSPRSATNAPVRQTTGPLPPRREIGPTNLTSTFERMAMVPKNSARPAYGLLPTGPAGPRLHLDPINGMPGSHPSSRAYNGSASDEENPSARPKIPMPMTIIPFKSLEQLAVEFRHDFSALFKRVEKWCFSYAKEVGEMASDQQLSHQQGIWRFIMKCTAANKADGPTTHRHTISLMRSEESRPWLVTRIFIQFLVNEMFSTRLFAAFDKAMDNDLQRIEQKLGDRAVTKAERGALITKRSEIIGLIVNHPNHLSFRSHILDTRSAAARLKMGPFLDTNCARSEAGKTIGNIVVDAWDLSIKMYTSYKSFVIVFPAVGDRFKESSMISRDEKKHPGGEAALQMDQTHLTLAMSPVITMRDDRSQSIQVRSVAEAQVLTKYGIGTANGDGTGNGNGGSGKAK